MTTLSEYLENPCRVLSLPYWKYVTMKLSSSTLIVHDNDFDSKLLHNFTDDQYFRLIHNMGNIAPFTLEGYYAITANHSDLSLLVEIINHSYEDLKVSKDQLFKYTSEEVYDPLLWIIVFDKKTNKAAGCGIADYDKELQEGILEWIQVLPEYRGRRIGKLIVMELLHRMRDKARFVTVSGKVDNVSKPEMLYRSCGFSGHDVWHILKKR